MSGKRGMKRSIEHNLKIQAALKGRKKRPDLYALLEQGQQHCPKCNQTKPISEFSPNVRGKVGNQCKSCRAKAATRRRHADPQRYRDDNKRWRANNPARVKDLQKQSYQKSGWQQYIAKKYGLSLADIEKMTERQGGRCYGCLRLLSEVKPNIDHNHTTGVVRGLLCRSCNLALGFVLESPETLRRLTAYLDRNPQTTLLYLAGALKNKRIPEIGIQIRQAGLDVMDEWWTPGEHADENWQHYESLRGRSYKEALRGRAATNTFLFDKSYIDLADVFVLVMPAGKSGMLELGYAAGRGKKTFLLLDGVEPDRYDIMPNAAYKIVNTVEELLGAL